MPDGEIEVNLTELERLFAEITVVERRKKAREDGKKDKEYGEVDRVAQEKDSMAAEMAFAKQYNLWPDFYIGKKPCPADFTVCEWKIDVKQTWRPDGRLLVELDRNAPGRRCHFYVLATGTDKTFILRGWAYWFEIMRPECKKNLGYRDTYVLDQDELHSMSEFLQRRIKDESLERKAVENQRVGGTKDAVRKPSGPYEEADL